MSRDEILDSETVARMRADVIERKIVGSATSVILPNITARQLRALCDSHEQLRAQAEDSALIDWLGEQQRYPKALADLAKAVRSDPTQPYDVRAAIKLLMLGAAAR